MLKGQFGEVGHEIAQAFTSILDDIYSSLTRGDARDTVEEHSTLLIWEWKAIGLVIDRFLLLIFILTTTIVTIGILFRPAFIPL